MPSLAWITPVDQRLILTLPLPVARGLVESDDGIGFLTSSMRADGWDSLDEANLAFPAITSALDFPSPEHVWPPRVRCQPQTLTAFRPTAHPSLALAASADPVVRLVGRAALSGSSHLRAALSGTRACVLRAKRHTRYALPATG